MICFNHPILRFWFVHFKGRYSVRSFFWLEWGGCIVGDAVWGIVLGSPLQVLVYPATEMTRLLLSHTSEERLCGAPGTQIFRGNESGQNAGPSAKDGLMRANAGQAASFRASLVELVGCEGLHY